VDLQEWWDFTWMVSDCEELVGVTHRRLKPPNCTAYQGW